MFIHIPLSWITSLSIWCFFFFFLLKTLASCTWLSAYPLGPSLAECLEMCLVVLSLPNSAKHWRRCVTISCRVSAPTSVEEPHPTSCRSSLWQGGGRRMRQFIQTALLFPGRFLTLVLVASSDLHTQVAIAAWYQSCRRENCSKKKNNSFHGSTQSYALTPKLKDSPVEPTFHLYVNATIINIAGFCGVKIQFIFLTKGKAKTLLFLNRPEWKAIF